MNGHAVPATMKPLMKGHAHVAGAYTTDLQQTSGNRRKEQTMSRYIDIEAFDDWHDDGYDLYASYEALHNAPSIELEPKRGEWIEFDTKWGRSLYYCTNCMETSEVPTAFGKPLYDFCPNCGADMREREGE